MKNLFASACQIVGTLGLVVAAFLASPTVGLAAVSCLVLFVGWVKR